MQVRLTTTKTSKKKYSWDEKKTRVYEKYLTLSVDEKTTKDERKVLRAIYLSNAALTQSVCKLPTVKGREGKLFFGVQYKMKDEVFHREQPQGLSVLSAPEVRIAIHEDRKKDDEIAYQIAQRQDALAKSLGLYKLVPKDLKPTFECRCGLSFKKNVTLLRHQRSCFVLRQCKDLFELCAIIQAQLKGKVASASPAQNKKGKTPKGKSAPIEVSARQPKGSKAPKKSTRATAKRNVDRVKRRVGKA